MRSAALVLLLWLAGLGAAAQFAKIAVVLPEIAALYPERGTGVGWLLSLISLVGLAFGLVAGVLAGRIGMRRLLVGSLVLGATMSAMQALVLPFPSCSARASSRAPHISASWSRRRRSSPPPHRSSGGGLR